MLQIKLMAKWVRLTLCLSALSLVNATTWLVTTSNQKANVYPIEADSIGIPIVLTISASIFALPILFLINMFPKNTILIWLKSGIFAISLVSRVGLLLLYAFVVLFAAYGITYWSFPGHYLIAISYLVLLIVLLMYLIFDWREIDRGLKG